MRQVSTQVKSDLIFNERLTDFSVDIYNYHGIYNLQGNRVNPDKNIVIGKYVWICLGAKILKGTEIADGCVVGGGQCYLEHIHFPIVYWLEILQKLLENIFVGMNKEKIIGKFQMH